MGMRRQGFTGIAVLASAALLASMGVVPTVQADNARTDSGPSSPFDDLGPVADEWWAGLEWPAITGSDPNDDTSTTTTTTTTTTVPDCIDPPPTTTTTTTTTVVSPTTTRPPIDTVPRTTVRPTTVPPTTVPPTTAPPSTLRPVDPRMEPVERRRDPFEPQPRRTLERPPIDDSSCRVASAAPPPPQPPCEDGLPVGLANTPSPITGDVMAIEPGHGSFVPDDLAVYPELSSPAANTNGALNGFARLGKVDTTVGTVGLTAMQFHLELPDGVSPADLDFRITSLLPDGTIAEYPDFLFSLYCYADQVGSEPTSIYAAGQGILIVDGEPVAPFVTFNGELLDTNGVVAAADTTTVYIGHDPIPEGATVEDAVGTAITQDGLDNAEGEITAELRSWAEAAIWEAADGVDHVRPEVVRLPLSLELTWDATIGSSGGLRVELDVSNAYVKFKRKSCRGEVKYDWMNVGLEVGLGAESGVLTASVDDGWLNASSVDVDLISGFCSFFLWRGIIENIFEGIVDNMAAWASFLASSPMLHDELTGLLTDSLGALSVGELVGDAVGLDSTIAFTSVVVQNGGLEVQANASFAPNGPSDGPDLAASVSQGPAPNLDFLTSLRTVETTGEQFGAGVWLSPDMLNQLVAAAVEEGAFSIVDTQGSTTAGELLLTGSCGLTANDTVFVDVAATTAPWLNVNPNAGGSAGITTSYLLTITDLRLVFRVADTGCGDGGVVGALSVNVNELGFEITGNSANQSLGFAVQMHPACPLDVTNCPITTATMANPLGAIAFASGINQLTGASVIDSGLDALVGDLATPVALPGAQLGLDLIPMAQHVQPGTIDAYFKVLPEPRVTAFWGFETTAAVVHLQPGEIIDLNYDLSATTNMPGPLSYYWSGGPGGGSVTTTWGSANITLSNVQVPDEFPAPWAYPDFSVTVTDEWGRLASAYWEDPIFNGNWV